MLSELIRLEDELELSELLLELLDTLFLRYLLRCFLLESLLSSLSYRSLFSRGSTSQIQYMAFRYTLGQSDLLFGIDSRSQRYF